MASSDSRSLIGFALRVIRSGSGITGIGIALSALSQFAASLLLLAAVSPGTFADMAVITIFVMFFATLLRLGTDRIFVGEVHAARAGGAPGGARQVGGALVCRSVVAGVVGGALIGLGVLDRVLSPALTRPLGDGERWLLAAWAAAEVVRLVLSEAHRSSQRFVYAAIAGNGLRNPMYLVLVLSLAALDEGSRVLVLGAAAIASVISLLLSLPHVAIEFPVWTRPWGAHTSAVSAHSLMLANTLLATLIGGADIWLVGTAFDAETTARYGFSVTLVSGLALISQAVSGGLAPRLAHHLARGDAREAQILAVRFVRVSTALAAAGWIFLVAVGEVVATTLGGDSYSGVTPLIAVLGLGQVLATASGIGGWVLVYARRYLAAAVITAAVAAICLSAEAIAALSWETCWPWRPSPRWPRRACTS